MNHFLSLTEAIGRGMCFPAGDGEFLRPHALTPEERSGLSSCVPFVFSPMSSEIPATDGEMEKIDAPFPAFSLEMSNSAPLIIQNDEVKISVRCIAVLETKPNSFVFFIHAYKKLEDGTSRHPVVVRGDDKTTPIYSSAVRYYLDRISKEQCGVQAVGTRFKIGSGANKINAKIKRVVHIRPKKKHVDLGLGSREVFDIDWSHRFEVRGHWRIISGVGKDRAGNYNVQNYTWVSHHVRGPEHLPLIKKSRIFDNKSEPQCLT